MDELLFPVPDISSKFNYETIRALLTQEEMPAYEEWLKRQDEAAAEWAQRGKVVRVPIDPNELRLFLLAEEHRPRNAEALSHFAKQKAFSKS